MVIAGPNVSVDRTIGLDSFDPGHVHRADRVESRLGGGGVNAARVASRLGASAVLVTLLPERDELWIGDSLKREGIIFLPVRCGGTARIATIMKERAGRTSVLNEPGAAVAAREWEEFERTALGRLTDGELLLCSGSLPPGAPAGGYARLARLARQQGAGPCLLDAAGPTLAAALEEGEGLVVPNLAEAEGVLSGSRSQPVHPQDTPERALAAAGGLIYRGAYAAVVTAGAAGAAYARQGSRSVGWVPAPPVTARNPVGAGDAFAAGLGLQLERRAKLEDAVAFAVAVAAAHVECERDGLDRDRVEALAAAPLS